MGSLRSSIEDDNRRPVVIAAMWIFGAANLWFAARGSWFVYMTLRGYAQVSKMAPDPAIRPPGFFTAFFILTGINVILLALLVCGGILLFLVRAKGIAICNAVFAAELIVFFFPSFTRPGFMNAFSAAKAVGNMGIAPQLLTAYPVLGLVILNLVRRRLHRTAPSPGMPVSG
jgi:hypothetical protein